MTCRRSLLALASIVALLIGAPMAHAIPALQLYSPDAVYDVGTESWTISDDTFELWVIGAVGDYGTIYDVTLAASYYGSAGSIAVSPNLALDPNYASKPGFTQGVQNHDEFKNADGHIFWQIGDFTSTSDHIQDYTSGIVPDPTSTKVGQINKYMIHVTGYDAVHFDAFDHYYSGTVGTANYKLHGVFVPPSHDATSNGGSGGTGGSGGSGGGGGSIPEPGILAMVGSGLLGILASRRRRDA